MSAPEKEKDAVRTTIVGGRPPGSGRSTGTIPRGLEVLVKKAAVDPEFRELLFAQRGAAAAVIELELDPAENAMLDAIPQEQLAQIVSQTTVPVEQRRVFLGRLAVAMLAVLGVGVAGCGSKEEPEYYGTLGIQPDHPRKKHVKPSAPTNAPPYALSDGCRPDRPTNAPPSQPPAPLPAGVRPDLPATNSPATNKPYATRGIQPDRPKTDATNTPPPPPAGIQPDRP
jgi:hypothetical protein